MQEDRHLAAASVSWSRREVTAVAVQEGNPGSPAVVSRDFHFIAMRTNEPVSRRRRRQSRMLIQQHPRRAGVRHINFLRRQASVPSLLLFLIRTHEGKSIPASVLEDLMSNLWEADSDTAYLRSMRQSVSFCPSREIL